MSQNCDIIFVLVLVICINFSKHHKKTLLKELNLLNRISFKKVR